MKSQREVERMYQKLIHDVKTKEFYKVDLTNRVNFYVCPSGHFIKTIDRHPGVTPMFIPCPICNSSAKSNFYTGGISGIKPTHEWYRPSLEECQKMRGKKENLLDHILMGGLELREIEKPKSLIYMADIKDVKL